MNNCRLCKEKTTPFLDFGCLPLPEEFRLIKDLDKPVKTYPLTLSYCEICHHAQLFQPASVKVIYKKNYFYDYSVTTTGHKHWTQLAKTVIKKYHLLKNDFVVDIGSNTGSLLQIFKSRKMKVLGVDPATKLVSVARKNGILTINDFFSSKIAMKIVNKYGRAKLITCNNTYDHVEDLTDFTKGVALLLDRNGTFVIEVPYFPLMLKNLTHQAYHQQFDYFSLTPYLPFLERLSLQLISAEIIPFHGGSIRMIITHKNHLTPDQSVARSLNEEKNIYKKTPQIFSNFAKKVIKQKQQLIDLCKKIKQKGKAIAGVGASAKGITLLNYCGIGPETIDFITEKSPLKINRFIPSGIPVLPDKNLFLKNPDYALILAWNFQKEVINNLEKYQGKFIIPIPKPKVL